MKESELELQILKWLNEQPRCFAFKINQSGFFDGKRWRKRNNGSLNGIADILGMWNGKPLAIEVKTPQGETKREQINFLRRYRDFGGIAMIARSLEQVKRSLPLIDSKSSKA